MISNHEAHAEIETSKNVRSIFVLHILRDLRGLVLTLNQWNYLTGLILATQPPPGAKWIGTFSSRLTFLSTRL